MQTVSELVHNTVRPPPTYKQIRHTKYYIKHGMPPNLVRKIFHKFPYDSFENHCISELESFLIANKIQTPTGWRKPDFLKILYCSRFKIPQAAIYIKRHIDWLKDAENQIIQPSQEKYINERYIFSIGKDKQFRPIIYLDLEKISKIPKKEKKEFLKIVSGLLNTLKNYAFVPGYIENWILIIDAASLGIFTFPKKMLSAFFKLIHIHFACCVDKIFVLNSSIAFNSFLGLGKSWSESDMLSKIIVLKKKETLSILLQDIDEDQLITDYGGKLNAPPHLWPIPQTISKIKDPTNDPQALIENLVPIDEDKFAVNFRPQNKCTSILDKLGMDKQSPVASLDQPESIGDALELLNVNKDKIIEEKFLDEEDYLITEKNKKIFNELNEIDDANEGNVGSSLNLNFLDIEAKKPNIFGKRYIKRITFDEEFDNKLTKPNEPTQEELKDSNAHQIQSYLFASVPQKKTLDKCEREVVVCDEKLNKKIVLNLNSDNLNTQKKSVKFSDKNIHIFKSLKSTENNIEQEKCNSAACKCNIFQILSRVPPKSPQIKQLKKIIEFCNV